MKRAELKEWMKAHNKGAVDVASLTGVSQKTVERFLKGEGEPSPLVIAALKRLLAADQSAPKQ